MTPRPIPKKILYWVAALHVVVLVVMLVAQYIGSIKKPRERHEITTFIDLSAPVAPPAQQPVQPKPLPPPPKQEPPKPKPKPKPVKKPIEKSTKRIKRSEPQPESPREVRRPVDPDRIEDILKKNLDTAAPARPHSSAFPASYLQLVRQKLYDAWLQPSELDRGLTAVVEIRIERNGSVSRRQMIRPSGNSAMDSSIMKALNAVTRIRPLPSSYSGSYRDVEVEFMLTGAM